MSDAVALRRGAQRLTVAVTGTVLTATRQDGTEAVRFTGGTAEDARQRESAYLARMERLGWEITD